MTNVKKINLSDATLYLQGLSSTQFLFYNMTTLCERLMVVLAKLQVINSDNGGRPIEQLAPTDTYRPQLHDDYNYTYNKIFSWFTQLEHLLQPSMYKKGDKKLASRKCQLQIVFNYVLPLRYIQSSSQSERGVAGGRFFAC